MVSGEANVRLRLDDGEPRWFGAPTGQLEIPVAGASLVEALIYSDERFVYQLEGLELDICPTCLSEAERATVVSERFSGWSISLFGSPEITRSPLGIVIEGRDGPAGVVFEKDGLNPRHRYLIQIEGNVVSANPILRFDLSGRQPIWLQVTEPIVERTISGADALKMWIYADAAFKYDLQGIRFDDCGYWNCSFDVARQLAHARDLLQRGFGDGVVAGIDVLLTLLSYVVAIVLIAVAVLAVFWGPRGRDRSE